MSLRDRKVLETPAFFTPTTPIELQSRRLLSNRNARTCTACSQHDDARKRCMLFIQQSLLRVMLARCLVYIYASNYHWCERPARPNPVFWGTQDTMSPERTPRHASRNETKTRVWGSFSCTPCETECAFRNIPYVHPTGLRNVDDRCFLCLLAPFFSHVRDILFKHMHEYYVNA